MEIFWTLQALSDLEAINDFIAVDNPNAAREVQNTIKICIFNLKNFPHIGRFRNFENIQELVIPGLPYVVIYQVSNKRIEILTIHHTSRDWPILN